MVKNTQKEKIGRHCPPADSGAKPKYNQQTKTPNPMSQQITINEELLKGGLELIRSYKHDEFITCTFKKPNSNFCVELTYEGSELVSAEMWCKDWAKINPDTIPLLAQFLNANNL